MEKKKVLVVDDEPSIVKVIEARLKASNYDVITASRGDEGLEKAEREQPDLIVLDVMMPVLDGYTFVRELKTSERLSKTPIIVLTAKEKLEDLFAMEGVTTYLTKPYSSYDLLEQVREHIG